MQYMINALMSLKMGMKTVILCSLLITMLLAPNLVWAQEHLPQSTTLGVVVLTDTIYSHKASDGTTTVYGEVQNNLGSPVNAVTLGVTFMDDNSNQVEYKTGPTLLQVVQPGGTVPFAISSTKADPTITQVQVKLAGFQSSSDRPQSLVITPGSLQVSDNLAISGNITDNGAQKSTNTKIYLISYDAFKRIVGIGVSSPVDVPTTQSSQFSIMADYSSRAVSYMLVAESDNFQSTLTPLSVVHVSLPVTVSNTTVTNTSGAPLPYVSVNSPVNISSTLNYVLDSTQAFTYYVQVKHFGGETAFIGKYDGVLVGSGNQNVTVGWTPSTAGSYFVETFVWDSGNVPLSKSVPTINLVLVK
jgi:hypothetical protein